MILGLAFFAARAANRKREQLIAKLDAMIADDERRRVANAPGQAVFDRLVEELCAAAKLGTRLETVSVTREELGHLAVMETCTGRRMFGDQLPQVCGPLGWARIVLKK